MDQFTNYMVVHIFLKIFDFEQIAKASKLLLLANPLKICFQTDTTKSEPFGQGKDRCNQDSGPPTSIDPPRFLYK